GDLYSTTANTGIFAGMPNQDLGKITFSTSSGTSMTFGDSAFGTFHSTSITEASNAVSATGGAVAFYVLGDWTPGSQGGTTGGPYQAEFTFSLTQPRRTEVRSPSREPSRRLPFRSPRPGRCCLLALSGSASSVLCFRRSERAP